MISTPIAGIDEIDAFMCRNPGLHYVDVLLTDSLGAARGKRLKFDALHEVFTGGFRLPASMFALDALGNTVEASGLGFDDGDADRPCLPIPGSLVPVPWLDEYVAQIQVTMFDTNGHPFFGDPRQVLSQVASRFVPLGLKPVVAVELEFYVVDAERVPQVGVRPPTLHGAPPARSGKQINSMQRVSELSAILAEISEACERQNVPASSALAESGPGQYEINLRHVADPGLASDHAVRLKRVVTGVFRRHGLQATFMPKPYADQAGSGAHVHVSLLQHDGQNAFASADAGGNTLLSHAIGGLAATMSESMLVFAPTANSYRRFRPECYVPLSPSWGINNRGVALRIPADDPGNRRVEHRVAGADANPYLLVAAVLAGMHHGLANRIDPGPPHRGNAYRDVTRTLPAHWREAATLFERSTFVRDYLGASFQHLFATTRRAELEAFDAHVSALEHEWYLSNG